MRNAFFQLKEAGLTDLLVWCAASGADNPALCPAFRVRRGRRATWLAMTSYVGSRASGYPPDSVSFRRYAGAPRRLQPPRTRCGHRARGGLALRLAGARLGKDPESGRCTKGKQTPWQGIASYGGKAAPTRATLRQFNQGLAVLSDFEPKSRSIVRSSETIFAFLKVFNFGESEISILPTDRPVEECGTATWSACCLPCWAGLPFSPPPRQPRSLSNLYSYHLRGRIRGCRIY
jgi:hypothetical protein